jgi:hypothetical protein
MSDERVSAIQQASDRRREWEPMRLSSVGRVGDLMQGGTGSMSEGGGTKMSGT